MTAAFTGRCPARGCDVEFVATHRAALVKLYHDHLRAEHVDRWVNA